MSKRFILLALAFTVCSALNAQQGRSSYVVLDGSRSFESQVKTADTIYEIRDLFHIESDLVLPQNCVLVFRGGALAGRGSVEGKNTGIDAAANRIFADDIKLKGTWSIDRAYCEWFGGSVSSKDNSKAIQRCLDAFRMLDLRAGSYEIGKTVVVSHDGTRICGVSSSRSGIVKTKIEKGEVNAVVYLQNPKGKNIQNIAIRDLKLSAASANVDYGIFTEGINSSDFRNLEIFKCKNGFYCKDETHGAVWNVVFDNIVFNCNTIRGFTDIKPYGYEEGTSCGITCITVGGAGVLFNKCWARDCAVGYRLKGLNYCEMNNCGADNIHGTAYQIDYYSVTMNACGMESVITSAAVVLYNSNCSISGLVDYRIIAKAGKEAYRVKVDGGKATFINCVFSEWSGGNVPRSSLFGVTSNNGAKVKMINTPQPANINSFMALTKGAVLESL